MLPILSVGFAAVLAAVLAATQLPQLPTETLVVSDGSVLGQELSVSEDLVRADGDELVARAARQLLALPGIEAKTRQRVDIFGQRLVGSGTYLQLVRGPQLLLRLDLKLQVGQQVTSLQQISDGHFFWIRYDLPQRKSLTRVNLKRLRQAASQSSTPPPPTLWMALGGLPKLLATLGDGFRFDQAEAIAVGRLPVWRIEGHWRRERLAQLLGDKGKQLQPGQPIPWDQLPDHLPHGVVLILGRDRVIPLFPYSIAFFRYLPKQKGQTGARRRQAIATLELFEVRLRPDLQPEHFEYRPGDQEVQEQTNRFIAQLRKTGKDGKNR